MFWSRIEQIAQHITWMNTQLYPCGDTLRNPGIHTYIHKKIDGTHLLRLFKPRLENLDLGEYKRLTSCNHWYAVGIIGTYFRGINS